MTQPTTIPNASSIIGAITWATAVAIFQALLWLAWLFLIVNCVPPLVILLRESDREVPIITQQLVTMSRFTSSYWYLLVLGGLPVAVLEIFVLVAAHVRRNSWLSVLRYASVALFSLMPLLLLLYALLGIAVTLQIAVKDLAPV